MKVFLETGQTVRWRGRRWRVIEEELNGFVKLIGLDPVNREQVATPLLALEEETLSLDVVPLPILDVESSDRARWRALHQAFLTTMAGGREQLRGIDWGAIAVEPYQLVPLMRVAETIRPRLLIADDTGLGKTAEAGIILRWLAQRHQASRILIVTRASPEPERWRDEMWTKFGFRFDILRNGADFAERRRKSPTINIFAQEPRVIMSMSLGARQLFLDELRQCSAPFDVIIVDEAHHLAERGSSTKRLSKLGRVLSGLCTDGTFLLLTATPHDGKTESFLSLLRLLDPLVEIDPGEVGIDQTGRLVVRRLKKEVTLAGGKKFQERKVNVVSTLGYATKQEKDLEKPLDAYLAWLSGEEDRYQKAGARQKAKGCEFLAGIYRKRFGSSVAALRATLRRRLQIPPAPEDSDDVVEYVDTDASDPEDDAIDPGAQSETPPPPMTPDEEKLAKELLEAAEKVPSGKDSKLEAMSYLLSKKLKDEKVVIFTEYRDTLRAAARRLRVEGVPFVTFHGGTSDSAREEAITKLNHDPSIRVFLATDAASEGKNLQRACHNLIHLDVPWNPNRYEQRNGRIDRYGQDEIPQIWALVAADRKKHEGRPEYRALEVVIEKLRRIQGQLGSVSQILPGYATGSVRDVLLNADKDAERRMEEVLAAPDLMKAHEELSRLTIRNKREAEEAEKLVARLGTEDDFESDLGALLKTAFHGWDDGGSIEEIEPGLVRVRVPARLRRPLGREVIDRATFRREIALAGQDDEPSKAPEFMSPAHPLVEATLRVLRDEATDPNFPHRFDVEAGWPEGLVLSHVLRFVDGEGRTVAEMLEAVEVNLEGDISEDYELDLERLGLHAAPSGSTPDHNGLQRWKEAFPKLAQLARQEAERRAEDHLKDLIAYAQQLRDEELEVLALWRGDQAKKVETLTLGTGPMATLEAAHLYDMRLKSLDAEYEARKASVRDRSEIRLASVDLIGGRLILEPTP